MEIPNWVQKVLASRATGMPLTPKDQKEIDARLEKTISEMYRRNSGRTVEQRRLSMFSMAAKCGFVSNDYEAVCRFLDERYKGL